MMPVSSQPIQVINAARGRLLALTAALVLAACASPQRPAPAPTPVPAPMPGPAPSPAPAPPPHTGPISQANTPREYRRDGAQHIYKLHGARIFKGMMPPLLQGVGTMQLELDGYGNIRSFNWMRPPSHAGAKAEIERLVRASAPFPAPVRMGRVLYTDTWLWDKSGLFQLDTLTEGQRRQ